MTPQPTMADWLALHGLSASACRALLNTVPVPGPGDMRHPAPEIATGLNGGQLWSRVATVLTQQMAGLSDEIAGTASRTLTRFGPVRDRQPPAFTLRDSGQGRPLVVCVLRGTTTDLLALAHEFGHALNYLASGDTDPPPILRETCAFVCEDRFLRGLDGGLAEPARACHARHTARYLGDGRARLLDALERPDLPYRYDWNYPPARLLAAALAQPDKAHLLPALFRGDLPLTRVIDAVLAG